MLNQCIMDLTKFSLREAPGFMIRNADARDIPAMINLFSAVFKSYPVPVFSMEYLKKVMNDHVLFKVAEEEGKILSIASADMDISNLNAEMTDCATHPSHRGRGILPYLISSLETDLQEKGFHTVYSLSRAINPGINKAFRRLKYKYSGRMINNCHICDGFEDMNIWWKNLSGSE